MAGLLVAAGLVHASIAPGHFAEWWGYGVAFGVAAAAQLGLGIAIAGWRSERALRAAAAVGVVAIGAWASSRTIGLPFAPGRRLGESAGALDLLTVTAEMITVGLLIGTPRRLFGRRGLGAAQAVGAFLIALLAVAFAAGVGHD